MINLLPSYVYLVFVLTTLAAVWLFCRSTADYKITATILLLWLILQGLLSSSGFYLKINNGQAPYQMALLLVPLTVTIILLFTTSAGRRYLDGFDLKKLTWLHGVRIAVELVIWWWWRYQLVPKGMTFEGANPDILSGITALVIVFLLNRKKGISSKLLLAWNFGCLLLVLNILIRGILSVPTPFQKFGLDQPNTAILYFPFIWLPACIVPLVILSHLIAIRKLLK
jgi:hypothetical protein